MKEILAGGMIKKQDTNGVLSLLFNRPDKYNALTNEMYNALSNELEGAQKSNSIRCVKLGTTSENFTAGNDINEFSQFGAKKQSLHTTPAMSFIHALACFSKPIVAAVPGLAVGLGTTMLLHCDMVFVETTTQLSAPFVRLGLSPEAGSSLLLPRLIGHQRAFSLFAGRNLISGDEAVTLGIALQCVEVGQSGNTATQAAADLALLPPVALQTTKRLLRPLDELKDRIELENQLFAERLNSEEATEAFLAFSEKRQPNFSNH